MKSEWKFWVYIIIGLSTLANWCWNYFESFPDRKSRGKCIQKVFRSNYEMIVPGVRSRIKTFLLCGILAIKSRLESLKSAAKRELEKTHKKRFTALQHSVSFRRYLTLCGESFRPRWSTVYDQLCCSLSPLEHIRAVWAARRLRNEAPIAIKLFYVFFKIAITVPLKRIYILGSLLFLRCSGLCAHRTAKLLCFCASMRLGTKATSPERRLTVARN